MISGYGGDIPMLEGHMPSSVNGSPLSGRERAPLLLREGYEFGSRECARQDADAVEVRLLGRPVTLLRGAAAAEVFYSDRLVRAGALPRRVQRTLVGQGTIQGLDGPAHYARKRLFLDLLGPAVHRSW